MALIEKLTAVADAIRGKTGGTEKLTLDGMATAIAGIVSGGGGGQFETGEIIGDGESHMDRNPLEIPISFEPSFVFVCLTDTTTTLDANHFFGGCIAKDIMCQASYRAANNANATNGGFSYVLDGWTSVGATYNKASYADGIFSWVIAPGGRIFYNGASYTWIAGKW